MSKSILSSIDRLMEKERKRALDDEDEPMAEVEIKGDPEAVEEAADDMGLPTPDKIMSGMDDDEEEAEFGDSDIVGMLEKQFPDTYSAIMRKLSAQ